MKKYFFIYALVLCAFVGCKDNSGLYGLLSDYDFRIAELEKICDQLNTNISSLQTIVEAQQTGDYITGITPIMENGKEIGYTITFANHEPITIYHGKNGTNGKDGKDGQNGTNGTNGANGQDGRTPIIGVAQDTDGIYYWTLDGTWILDGTGNKIRVTGKDGKDGQDGMNGTDGTNGTNGTDGADGQDGITPQLKIEADYWYISYDGGTTWTQLGKAKGDKGEDGADGQDGQDGDSMFQSVTYDDNNVYFTLANGTLLTISKNSGTVQIVNGAMMAPFSVSATKKVYFSQGNLEYNVMQGTHQCVDGTTKKGAWRFAENQWDIIGEDNRNISSSYNGWIDLFAWGTSGYKYKPDSLYQTSSSYASNHLAISGDIEYTRNDWGYYNAITNADHSFEWRTLNHNEWEYLLSNHDWYFATVNDVKGLILVPELYDEPVYISHVNHNSDFSKYIYNLRTWKLLENQGAVFLPNAGMLSCSFNGTVSYGDTGTRLVYWTSSLKSYKASTSDPSYSYVMQRPTGISDAASQELYYPVRLVRDVEE